VLVVCRASNKHTALPLHCHLRWLTGWYVLMSRMQHVRQLLVFACAGIVLTPCFLYWLWPPVVRSTPEGPATAAARLQEMGPLSTDEKIMIGAVTLAVGLWVSVKWGHTNSTVAEAM
jgi:di/tricarboxylate transporter